MPFEVGQRVKIKAVADDGSETWVPAVVSTVSDETPYGVILEGDDIESTWYVDSEMEANDEPGDPSDATDGQGTQPRAAAAGSDPLARILANQRAATGRDAPTAKAAPKPSAGGSQLDRVLGSLRRSGNLR